MRRARARAAAGGGVSQASSSGRAPQLRASSSRGARSVPQAQTHAGFGAARPARALIRPVAGNAFGDQTVEARGRIKTHGAGQARVDHHPYPFNGQAGFGYGGGEHYFAAARRGRGDGRVLVGGGQIAVQGMHGHAGREPGQSFGGASDFTRAGQKSQNAAGFFGEGQAHGPFHGRNRVRPSAAPVSGRKGRGKVAQVHGPEPPLGTQYRAVAQQAPQRVRVQSGGHDQQAQIGP